MTCNWLSFCRLTCKRDIFSQICSCFILWCNCFESLFGCAPACICHELRTEKDGILSKVLKYKQSNWYEIDLDLKLQKRLFWPPAWMLLFICLIRVDNWIRIFSNCESIIKVICIQLTFTFYIMPQNGLFLAKYDKFFT